MSSSYAVQSPWNGGPHVVKSVGGQSYRYDANGNMLSGGGRQYTWTSENLPASIKGPDGVWEYYTYDAEGARAKQTRGSATTTSIGGLLEISGSVTTSSYQFNGQIVAMRDSSAGVRSLHGDHLGSVSLATNASGTVVSRQEFDPWGQLRSGGISQTDMNDTGQRLDDTGLLYYHARMYDPALARFVSADSIVPGMAGSNGGAAARLGYDPQVALRPLTVDFHESGFVSALNGEQAFTQANGFHFQLSREAAQQEKVQWGPANPQALNRYAYVLNNPLRYIDPTGHTWYLSQGGTDPCDWFTPGSSRTSMR